MTETSTTPRAPERADPNRSRLWCTDELDTPLLNPRH